MFIVILGEELSHGLISCSWVPIYETFEESGAVIPLTFKSKDEAIEFTKKHYPGQDFEVYQRVHAEGYE